MNKKLVALMVAVLMMTVMMTAAYASAPSRTTQNLTTVRTVTTTEEEEPVEVAAAVVPNTPEVEAAIEEIAEFLATHAGEPVANFFSDDVKAKILEKLPAGITLDKFVINEIVTVNIEMPVASTEPVEIAFDFATTYEDGQNVVGLVGVPGANGEMEWIPVEGVVEDGQVKLTFEPEVLAQIAGKPVALAVLSEEEA